MKRCLNCLCDNSDHTLSCTSCGKSSFFNLRPGLGQWAGGSERASRGMTWITVGMVLLCGFLLVSAYSNYHSKLARLEEQFAQELGQSQLEPDAAVTHEEEARR